MAEAIIGAAIKSKLYAPECIMAGDLRKERLAALADAYHVKTTAHNMDVFNGSDTIVLAVKPQSAAEVLGGLAAEMNGPPASRKLIISILAGTPIEKLQSLLFARLDKADHHKLPIIRVMPNTPALVLRGMSGMSANAHCTPEDTAKAKAILSGMGKVLEFEEGQLDAVTALSGSGPAYFFYFIDAMASAGKEIGLSPETATELAVETAAGAAKLMTEQKETPADLIRKVASPGGTTQAALDVFNANNLKDIIRDGVFAAARRSEELSRS